MRKFIFPVLVAALIAATSVSSVAPPVKAQTAGLVSSTLTRMERNKQSLKSLHATISMQKYNAQLRDKDDYVGVVFYIPGAAGSGSAFVRLEWTKPQHEVLTVANGNYILYRPRLGLAYTGKTGSIKSQKDGDVLALMNMSATQLRTRFGEFEDVREETLWGGVHTTHFKATPKTMASYSYIEVWVDDSGMPVQTKMVEKNDDSTTVRLTNIDKNQTIPNDHFTQKLDSSVKRVKG